MQSSRFAIVAAALAAAGTTVRPTRSRTRRPPTPARSIRARRRPARTSISPSRPRGAFRTTARFIRGWSAR